MRPPPEAVLALVLAAGITFLFARAVLGAVRTGRLRGIGWSLSRGEHPIAFTIQTVALTMAGSVGAAFCLLLGWVLLR